MTSLKGTFSQILNSPGKNLTVSGAIACVVVAIGLILPGFAQAVIKPPFEVTSFTDRTIDESGDNYSVAGGHQGQNEVLFKFPDYDDQTEQPSEQLLDGGVTLLPGFFGNPSAAPRGSQIGVAHVELLSHSEPQEYPIFNMEPARGYPAQFAFSAAQSTLTVLSAIVGPRTDSYQVTVGAKGAPRARVRQFGTTFYGVPSEHGQGTSEAPFLSNPVDCSEANPAWQLILDTWEKPGALLPSGFPDLSDPNWWTPTAPAPPVEGCEGAPLSDQFKPTIKATPLQGGGPVQADQPSGLSVELEFPQSNDPTDPKNTVFDPTIPQAPTPKDVTTTLPAGLSVSPSSADGLVACSDLASSPAGDQVHYEDTKPVRCPNASKIGSVTTLSPLLAAHDPVDDHIVGADPLGGSVYLLAPHPGDLPTGGGKQQGKFRLLIVIESPRYGLQIKLPGLATADPNTGQLSATFPNNPQLPARILQVNLKPGPRAPLASPTSCGAFTTTTDLVPWSTPYTPNAHPSSTFNVSSGPNGSACPLSPASRPFAPTISAGMDSNAAGKYSPFVLRLNRGDGEQELSTIDVTTPKGFSAKLAGVPYCSEAAIAAASSRSGFAEQANPSCPAASQIGTVSAGAGPGSTPYYASGKAYLAGPYKGAPLSFAFITPAVAGPFDLGTVVVRAAAFVDPETAQVTTKTDPLPQIIDGVPLKLRSVVARLDRSNFTINPTNCSAMSVSALIGSANGASANPTNHFQVDGCKGLGFKPKLKLELKGATKRGSFPALRATLNYPPGSYANIAKAQVTLPHSEFLEQSHIKTICTRVQFAAKACPAASIYGKATATTPLLDAPLSGPVYLRSSSNKLPDLVADLNGQIHVALVGRIDSIKGGIRTTFEGVPDAPVSKFVLEMQGGKKGLLVNSTNICNSDNHAIVALDAQNGLSYDTKPELINGCKKSKKSKGKKANKRRGTR